MGGWARFVVEKESGGGGGDAEKEDATRGGEGDLVVVQVAESSDDVGGESKGVDFRIGEEGVGKDSLKGVPKVLFGDSGLGGVGIQNAAKRRDGEVRGWKATLPCVEVGGVGMVGCGEEGGKSGDRTDSCWVGK